MIDFNGKVILVTGGSRGIGAATVKAMVKAGANVVLHYGNSSDAANAIAKEVGAERCHLIQADLAEPGIAISLWEQAMAWKGHVDVLVNNAGIATEAKKDGSDEGWHAVWQKVPQVNLIASADLSRQAVNTWQNAAGEGVRGIIINIASRAAWRGDAPDEWPYAASKGGMISMMKTIARAYAADGILSYAVAPGFTETEMATEAFEKDPEFHKVVVRDIPMGDIAPPEDVANTICFLASGLAPHATGTTIDVNGASYVR